MKISLIIAAYNVNKFIEKCILSCCDQDLSKSRYEIIIINDGSIDLTLSVLEKFQKLYENIVVITQENSGLGAVRNKGILKAKGEYIWFVDGDDYIERNILRKVLNILEDDNLDTLALNYSIVDAKYETTSLHANNLKLDREIITGSEFYKENYEKSYSCFFIFRKSIFIESNVFFKERINMQDSEILPKLLIHVDRLSFFNKTCYYYVQHPNSFTNSNNGQKRFKYFESIIEVKESLVLFLEKEGKNNMQIKIGLEKKIEGLHHVVFNHLLYFNYEKEWLLKILKLLKENKFYPLQHKAIGKMKLLKTGLNNYPVTIKWVINKIQASRK